MPVFSCPPRAGPLRHVGRSLKEVRAVLRLDIGSGFTFSDAVRRLPRADAYEIRRLMADLVTDEWLVQDFPDHWVATDKAREMQTASRGRLTRVRAQAVLTTFMERVRNMNDDAKYAFKVDCVVLFGSYLSGRDRIGDIDLAVKFTATWAQQRSARDA